LDLVKTVGSETRDEHLSLRISTEMRAIAGKRLRMLNIAAQDKWIILHPGASATSRRYPPALWRDTAMLLAQHIGCPLVFTGTTEEVELIEEITDGIPGCHSLAGTLNLGELAALIHAAPLMICNNTGPAHIAAAVSTPIVNLYALTNPQHTPWLVPSRILFQDVPCRYCYKSVCPQGHHDCLQKVEPATVVEAALDLFCEIDSQIISKAL
jgi:ADP-heptose:LPS heptosyltransferase